MAKRHTGIRRAGEGWEAYGRCGARQFSKRFPLATPLPVMRAWREETARALAPQRAAAGTVAGDVDKFLAVESGRRRTDFEDLLTHWTALFGTRPTLSLGAGEIQLALDAWRAQDVAASTLNHRRQALRSLFRRLYPDMANPVDRTKGYKQPEPEPRAIPDNVARAILDCMTPSKTKARLWVIYHTGMRQSELARVRPEDVRLDGAQPQVFIRSGKGGRPRVLPLHSEAVEAFREMARLEAWGSFQTASMRKTWLDAAYRAGHATAAPGAPGKWTNKVCQWRPYDLRHRFATRLRERGADLADVQELLGHKNIQTTRRYAPVVHAKLVSCVNALVQEASWQ